MRSQNNHSTRRTQRGVTTLAITLILLGVLTLMVLFSMNVGFFEQRATTNESRAQTTEQLAEYALNLSGEYLKANRANIISDGAGTGWFEAGAVRWKPCPVFVAGTTHPCDAERDPTRRAGMYYYDNDPATASIEGLPYPTIAGAVGGALTGDKDPTSTVRFGATTAVNALLCRIDFDVSNPTNPVPKCALTPPRGRDIAVTLVADVQLPGENSSATLKETWATVSAPMPSAAVPLVASGIVKGLGNAQIVASPNAGGYGIAASIWAPSEVDIGDTTPGCASTTGIGSFLTCHLGDYLSGTPRENLLTACAGTGSPCGCPAMGSTGVDSLSGHSGVIKRESFDVLDMDGGCGGPDIQFFPLEPNDRPRDPLLFPADVADPADDSIFEYTFGVDYVVSEGATVVNTNCGTSGTQNCAAFALLEEYGATQLPDCTSLDSSSAGIFYVTGDCTVGSFGSPTDSVIVVVDGHVHLGNGNNDFYGILFARSDDAATALERVSGTSNIKIFGALIVEGSVALAGQPHLIYQEISSSAGAFGSIPPNVKFGKVAGSWLDNRVGI